MTDCPCFRPDHNGECLHCDEWADAHTPAALAHSDLIAALEAQIAAMTTSAAEVAERIQPSLVAMMDLDVLITRWQEIADNLNSEKYNSTNQFAAAHLQCCISDLKAAIHQQP